MREDKTPLVSCGEDVAPVQKVLAHCLASKAAYPAEKDNYAWVADGRFSLRIGEESYSLRDRMIGGENPNVVVCRKVVSGAMKIVIICDLQSWPYQLSRNYVGSTLLPPFFSRMWILDLMSTRPTPYRTRNSRMLKTYP